jgi:CheY-like chemotaxis protein
LLRGDPHRLRQLLLNLLGNAIKFTSQGEVTVSLSLRSESREEIELHCAVCDTGIGVSAEACQRLFQPFIQADGSTTRKFGGTGLGLAICRKLVELMAGTIGIISTEGKGSTFWFTIRLKKLTPAERSVSPDPASPPRPTAVCSGAPARILLVEDDQVTLRVTGFQLRRLGCQFASARTGREALTAWQSSAFDLILMDCQMPEMDGYEATRQIRALEGQKSLAPIPIIALTANAMKGDSESCLAAGMSDYLTKPVDFNELTALLQRWCPGRIGIAGDPRAVLPK